MIRKLIVSVLLVLVAGCSEAGAIPQPSARIVLKLESDTLLASELRNLNRLVVEALRATPLIPVRERTPQGDAVVVQVANAADIQAAINRLKAMGNGSQYTVAQRTDGAIAIGFSSSQVDAIQKSALNASREVVQRRVLGAGVANATITTQGKSRISVQASGLNEAEVQALADLLTTGGLLTFNLVDTQADPADYQIGVPRNSRMALPNESLDGEPQVIMLDAIISGSDLSGAQRAYDDYGHPNITFQLHSSGTQKFARATAANIGRPFAIVLDDHIVSAPVIQSEINGGSGQITGQFTVAEADRLAVVLRSGALPAKLMLEEILAQR